VQLGSFPFRGSLPRLPEVTVRRIKPNILSERFDESRRFYNDVIGLEGGHGLDWILFFGTDKREVQLSVMKLDVKAHVHADVSIEVDDVDAVYDRARAAGSQIVYPLADEEWGLRRFFVRDPNGAVINVTEHDQLADESPGPGPVDRA
jgi:catechol 2,3-dioxygenase-like lactoylglutathione lyase family enzyme